MAKFNITLKDKSSLYDKAQKFITKGQWNKAIELMEMVYSVDKHDAMITLRLGDLYKKVKRDKDAANFYFKTANIFADDGHTTKAAATYKMILRIDPSLTEVQEKLDELTTMHDAAKSAGSVSLSRTPSQPAMETASAKPAEPAIELTQQPVISTSGYGEFEMDPAPVDASGHGGIDVDVSDVSAGGLEIEHGIGYDAVHTSDSEAPKGVVELSAEPKNAEFFTYGQAALPSADLSSSELDEGLVGGSSVSLDFDIDLPASPPSDIPADMYAGFAADIDAPPDGLPLVDLPSADSPPPERKEVEFLLDLEEEELWELLGRMDRLTFGPGEPIIQEGDTGDSIYIITSGKVSVATTVKGKKVKLAELGEQEFFGEVSFLTGRPRTADVVAVETTNIMELSRSEVNGLIQKYPNIENVLRMFHENRVSDTLSTMKTASKDFF